MEPVKCVIMPKRECSSSSGLEEFRDWSFKLREISGEVNFVEIAGHRGSLNLRIDGCDKKIWWQQQETRPIFVRAGDKLRGFYENISNEGCVISLEAYEILNNGKVLCRGTKSDKYRFIE